MSLANCSKCRELYNQVTSVTPLGLVGFCPRCAAIAELLAAAEALNTRVRDDLARAGRLLVAVVKRSDFEPLVERTARAIETARAL